MLPGQVFHHVEPFLYRFHIFQREKNPPAKHPRTHRGDCLVYHFQQAFPFLVHRHNQFKIADSEFVEPHIFVFFDAYKGGYVLDMLMLRKVKVIKDCSGGYYAELQMLYTETFQVFCLEMFQQPGDGGIVCEYPIVQREDIKMWSETFFKILFFVPFHQDFLGRKIVQKFIHIIRRTLGSHELSSGNIEECHTATVLVEMDGSKEIVLFMVQYRVVDGNARRHQLRDSAFHQLLGKLRVFQLVTDSHPLTCPHQFR